MCKHYQELKAKGVEFPTLDPELASQTFIPEKVLAVIFHFGTWFYFFQSCRLDKGVDVATVFSGLLPTYLM